MAAAGRQISPNSLAIDLGQWKSEGEKLKRRRRGKRGSKVGGWEKKF